MAEIEERLVAAQAFAGLAASECGDGGDERPPLVLLHGLTFDRTMWQPALEELATIDPERRALAFDLPGHGQSPAAERHNLDELVARVHAAVSEAEIESPVVVGHSMAAVVATLYAARHPVSGVVNIDQPLRVEPFAQLVGSLRDRLDSDQFPQVWQQFWNSMGTEQLPPDAQQLLRTSSRPQRELVLSYWHDLLTRPADELAALMDEALATLHGAHTPYAFVLGRELAPDEQQWLRERLPDAKTAVLPGSGHFPQLADPQRFAHILAATTPRSHPRI